MGILPLDINHSQAMFTVEDGKLRVPLGQVRGVSRPTLAAIIAARNDPFASLNDFVARVTLPRPAIENLIMAGAFDSLSRDRRALLWRLPRLERPSIQSRLPGEWEDQPEEGELQPAEKLAAELDLLGLALSGHPMDAHRDFLRRIGVVDSNRLEHLPNGAPVTVAGLVIARMTPPTKTGQRVLFLTLEDKYGLTDAVVFPAVQERFGRAACFGAVLIVRGKLRREGERGVSVTAESVVPLG